jgi:hypothetical protein
MDHKIIPNFPIQGLPKYTQIRFFCMKIYHLATLIYVPPNCSSSWIEISVVYQEQNNYVKF